MINITNIKEIIMKKYIKVLIVIFIGISFSFNKQNLSNKENNIEDIIINNTKICLSYYQNDIAFKKGIYYISIDSLNIQDTICNFVIKKFYYKTDHIYINHSDNYIKFDVKNKFFTHYFELYGLKVYIFSNNYEDLITKNFNFKKVNKKIKKDILKKLYDDVITYKIKEDTTSLIHFTTILVNEDNSPPDAWFFYKKGKIEYNGFPPIIPFPYNHN